MKQQLRVAFFATLALTIVVLSSCGSEFAGILGGGNMPSIAVVFDANSGTWPESANAADRVQAVGVNGKVKQLPLLNPTLEGHNFLGWYTQKLEPVTGSEKVTEGKFTTATKVTQNTIVYALYKAKTVEIDDDGVQHPAGSVTFIQCSGGDIVGEPVETLWSNGYKLDPSEIPVCGEREHYNQTADQLNKWWLDVYDVMSGELTEQGAQFTANIQVSKTNEDGAVIEDDIAVYARWSGDTYTVTFNPQGGTFVDQEGVALSNQTYTAQVQYPELLPSEVYPFVTKTGDAGNSYTLGGWYDPDKDTIVEGDVEFDGVVDRNMTVFANWISSEADNGVYTATGGETSIVEIDGAHYELHVFKAVGSHLYYPPEDASAENPYQYSVLVVAGGGGGGKALQNTTGRWAYTYQGGGGGAGGLITKTGTISSPSPIVVTVGTGGAGGTAGDNDKIDGKNGGNSRFASFTALGGGGGGGHIGGISRSGHDGGSGGGIGGGWGSPGQAIRSIDLPDSDYKGNRGGSFVDLGGAEHVATGGGGAGSAGIDATSGAPKTSGGAGFSSDITGSAVIYAAGGNTLNDTSTARDNSGNGGSGGYNGANGLPGSSGIVIVRFARPDLDAASEV